MPTPHPARARGGSLEDLRRANRRLIMGHLVTEGPQSRAELSRSSGLSASTVSSLVNEMLEAGHLRETTLGRAHKGGSGRPPVLVELATPPGGVVGVDIGHGHVRVAAAGPTGDVLAEDVRRFDVDTAGPPTLDIAADDDPDDPGLRRAGPRPGARRRDVRPRPDRPRDQPGQHRHPAGLARREPGGRAGAAHRGAGHRRQRRQPRCARRGPPRRGARAPGRGLREARQRRRVRARARRAGAPRCDGDGRRARARADRRGRRRLPLRQPRVPGDAGGGQVPAARPAAGPRRGAHAGPGAGAGGRRRRRRTTRALRRRHHHRPRAGRPLQPPQPRR